jgi:hypothetical protein
VARVVSEQSACSDEVDPWTHSQLVHISQIGETQSRLHDGMMDVEVTVGLLCRCYHIDKFVHSRLYFWQVTVVQEVASTFNPFSDIRVPEQMVGTGGTSGGSE